MYVNPVSVFSIISFTGLKVQRNVLQHMQQATVKYFLLNIF